MKGLLILDRCGYQIKDAEFKKIMSKKYSDFQIVYTTYEDNIIRKVRNWPILGNFLLHILRWRKSFNYAKLVMRKTDIDEIICLNPIVGVMCGLLKSNEKNCKLMVCGFLFEEKKNIFYYAIRKVLTKFALKNMTKVIVYSSVEVKYYEKIFKLRNKFFFVKYGIDYLQQKEYNANKLPLKYLFSGGGSNRDYPTLVSAYNKISNLGYPLVIATQPWRLNDLDISKLTVLPDVVNETFGDVMKRSELLVLSLKNTSISAGHMVLLQAMSLGVPVLVNDIPAIRDYVDDTVVEFYESGNVDLLTKKIVDYLSSNKKVGKSLKAKKLYQDNYTSCALINRLINIL